MEIPNTNSIELFFHCAKCIKEKPPNVSPKDWSMIQAGWTKAGLQVWCDRHNINIVHIDFEGHRHPANLSAAKE